MNKTLFIVGGTSTAYSIRETVEIFNKSDYENIFNIVADGDVCDYSYINDSQLKEILEECNDIRYIVGFTNNKLRSYFSDIFLTYGGKLENVIHPNAYIFKSAKIGYGNYIACNAVISSRAVIGNSNLINYGCSIGHDSIVGNDCVFNPGSRIGGCSKIGNRCLFGANSFVFQGTSITDDCKIDALVYLHRNLLESTVIRNSNRFI